MSEPSHKTLSLPLSHTACAVLPPRGEKSASDPIFDLPAEQTTQIYARIVDKKKEQAVDLLDNL